MAQQFNYAVYQERLSRLEAKTEVFLQPDDHLTGDSDPNYRVPCIVHYANEKPYLIGSSSDMIMLRMLQVL